MIIHDTYLEQIEKFLFNEGRDISIVQNSWEIKKNSDYILATDTILELGSTNVKNANLTLCTSDRDFKDRIALIGKDIPQLKGKVNYFSKVIIVSLKEETDENTLYSNIKEVSRARLGLNFKGTMLRASSSEERECFRISKEAYKKGLNFSILGSALIHKLKKLDFVKNVQIYYIVNNKELNKSLIGYQSKIKNVTDAMNHVFDDIELDCGSCAIKEVCDEVDGMRDAHMKQHNT